MVSFGERKSSSDGLFWQKLPIFCAKTLSVNTVLLIFNSVIHEKNRLALNFAYSFYKVESGNTKYQFFLFLYDIAIELSAFEKD